MSIAMWVKVEQIEKRLAAVELAQAAAPKTGCNGASPPAALAAQAEQRRQASLALRSEIRSIMAAHSGPERLTAKRICRLLARNPSPKERTVMDHMKEINAASSVPRS